MAADRKRSANATKILVFVPPRICLHNTEKKSKIDAQVLPEVKWDKTYFKFDGHKFVNDDEAKIQKDLEVQNSSRIDSEVSAGIGIVLDYGPELVQESINSYLDEEFFQANQTTCLRNSLAPFESLLSHDKVGGFDRLQREYETMNFESQILLGNSLSDGSSLSRRVSRGTAQQSCDENTHQLTEDDVYTQLSSGKRHESPLLFSQATASQSVSKEDKKEREDCGVTTVPGKPRAHTRETLDLIDPGTSKIQTNVVYKRGRSLPKLSDKLTYLAQCDKNDLVNVCVIVLQVNPVKEIQIKSGRNKGEYIPLSSVIVADVSKSHFKVTLWRQASCWTARIIPGDIIIATSIRIETWRNENIGQTTLHSCFYNLHQPVKPLSHDWLELVSQERLDALIKQAGQDYWYLFRNTTASAARQQMKFCRISEMRNNTLVHFRGVLRKVEVMENQTNDGTYQFGNQRLPKIRIVFAESPEDEIIVTLWGRQAQWLHDFRTAEGTVWELQYLTAKHEASSGTMVLHTTPKSTKTKLTEENLDAKRLLSVFGNLPNEVQAFKSIKDVLDAKFSGSAEVRGFISGIVFYPDTKEVLNINCSRDVEVLNDRVPLLTYVGCASCFRLLTRDKNQIYGQCAHCVHHKPDYNYRVAQFYRNFTVKITDSRNDIEVHVKHDAALKMFKGIPANQLTKTKQHQSSGQNKEFVERVKKLVSSKEKSKMILSCQTILDENSFVVSRTFTLIDIIYY